MCSDPSRTPANLCSRHLHLKIIDHREFGNDVSPVRGLLNRGRRKSVKEVGDDD
jgi:hypothetical protein